MKTELNKYRVVVYNDSTGTYPIRREWVVDGTTAHKTGKALMEDYAADFYRIEDAHGGILYDSRLMKEPKE